MKLTQTTEGRLKVNQSEIIRFWDILKKAKFPCIISHINPEGDAIGSSLALSHAIRKLGKNVKVVNKTGVPETLSFLPGANKVTKKIPDKSDLYIIVDSSSIERTGFNISPAEIKVINIDHHITNSYFGFINIVDPEAASTSVIIFRILTHLRKDDIGYEELLCIYTGLYEDTGGFSYSNTNGEAFRVAEYAVKRGVDPSYVARMLNEEYPLRKFLLLQKALKTLKVYPEAKTAVIKVSQKMKREVGASWEDTERFVDYAKSIRGVEVGVLLNERDDGSLKVSLRSKGKIDVSKIAMRWGGGGHFTAAGFEIKDHRNWKKHEREIINTIREFLI